MSIGTKLLTSLIDHEKGLSKWIKFGLIREYFKGEEVELYDLIAGHILKFGVMPSRDTVKEHKILLPDTVPEPPEFYLEAVSDRFTRLTLKEAAIHLQDMLNAGKVKEAYQGIFDTVLNLQKRRHHNKLVNYSVEGGAQVISHYKKMAVGEEDPTIKLGWPSFDDMFGGLMGGDLLTILGRPGLGKTYLLLYVLLTCWANKVTPLLISMEMKPLLIMQRLAAMQAKIPITGLKKGLLTTHAINKLSNSIAQNVGGGQPLWVVDGALSATVDDIEILCHQLKPGIVLIDGAYLLRHKNNRLSKFEKITENAERIKEDIAERFDIPVAATYQLNRESVKQKREGKVGVEGIAGSDAIGQLSSVALGLFQSESVETVREREVEIIKGRNGESGSFKINWIFDQGPSYMDFSEIQEKEVKELTFV